MSIFLQQMFRNFISVMILLLMAFIVTIIVLKKKDYDEKHSYKNDIKVIERKFEELNRNIQERYSSYFISNYLERDIKIAVITAKINESIKSISNECCDFLKNEYQAPREILQEVKEYKKRIELLAKSENLDLADE